MKSLSFTGEPTGKDKERHTQNIHLSLFEPEVDHSSGAEVNVVEGPDDAMNSEPYACQLHCFAVFCMVKSYFQIAKYVVHYQFPRQTLISTPTFFV